MLAYRAGLFIGLQGTKRIELPPQLLAARDA
jgi:hypothetical protein